LKRIQIFAAILLGVAAIMIRLSRTVHEAPPAEFSFRAQVRARNAARPTGVLADGNVPPTSEPSASVSDSESPMTRERFEVATNHRALNARQERRLEALDTRFPEAVARSSGA
jgi:hypothetical protein